MDRHLTVVATVLSCLLAFSAARADTITVTTDADTTGGPDCTLRDAITAADSDAAAGGCPAGNGLDTIELPAGATIFLTANSGLQISSAIIINGNGATVARPDKAGTPSFRIFTISGAGTTLNDLTLSNGESPNNQHGGCVSNSSTSLSMNNCIVSGCTADNRGGGVHNSGVSFTFNGGAIIDNSAQSGGGIWSSGLTTVRESTIAGNSSTFDAGGLVSAVSGHLTVIDCTISGNTRGVEASEGLDMTNCTVSGNGSEGV
jgi:CSLREA domain-containing protein